MDKKYITEDIDFTGCHPVIADAIRANKSIACLVWDDHEDKERFTESVSCFYHLHDLPYTSTSGTAWKHAEPITRAKQVKSAIDTMQWLLDNKYECKADGQWKKRGGRVFRPSYFMHCGCSNEESVRAMEAVSKDLVEFVEE